MISFELSHYQLSKRFKFIRKTTHTHLGDAILFKDAVNKRRVIAKVFNFLQIHQLQDKLAQIQQLLQFTNSKNSQNCCPNNFCQFLAYSVNLNHQHTKQAYFIYDYHQKTLDQEIKHMELHHKHFQQKDIVKFMQKMFKNLNQLEKKNMHHECLTGQLILTDSLGTIESSFKMLLTPFLEQAVNEIVNKLRDARNQERRVLSCIEQYNLSKFQLQDLHNRLMSNNTNNEFNKRVANLYQQKCKTDKQSLGLLVARMICVELVGIYKYDSTRQKKAIWNDIQLKRIIQDQQISQPTKNIIQTLLFSQNSQLITFANLYQRAKQLNDNFSYANGSASKKSTFSSKRSRISHQSKQRSASKMSYSSASKASYSVTNEVVKINWDSRTNSAYTQSPPKEQQQMASSPFNERKRLKQELYNSNAYKTKNVFMPKLTIQDIQQRVLLDRQGKPFPGIVQKEYKDGAKYVGQLAQGIRHGKGVYYYVEGDVYGGDWNQNVLQGSGLYLFTNGQYYQGQIRDGLKHGKGTYIYSNGNKYSGQWRNDKKDGHGYYQYVNRGDKYQGSFKNGFKQGKGVYFWKNGDHYQGQFWENLKHGHGKGVLSNNTVLTGNWSKDQIQGVIKIKFGKGDQYIGEFKENSMNGCGNYKYVQGVLYEGQFKQDKQTGKCQVHFPNGDKYTGQIKNGRFHGKGKYFFKNQNITYQGHWGNGVQNGKGRVIFENGCVIQSDWYAGVSAKNGTIFYPNKDKYIGQINSSGRNGQGVYYFYNGRILKARWQNNKILQNV